MPKVKSDEAHGEKVKVRITKFGDGMVSTGVHIAEQGDIMAKKDDILSLSPKNAQALEALGYAEIVQ